VCCKPKIKGENLKYGDQTQCGSEGGVRDNRYATHPVWRKNRKSLFLLAVNAAHARASCRCYLLGHVSDNVGKFLDHKVDTLEAGLFQPRDLFLYDRLKSHVGGKKANSDAWAGGKPFVKFVNI
jgi:hypothetical protein